MGSNKKFIAVRNFKEMIRWLYDDVYVEHEDDSWILFVSRVKIMFFCSHLLSLLDIIILNTFTEKKIMQ